MGRILGLCAVLAGLAVACSGSGGADAGSSSSGSSSSGASSSSNSSSTSSGSGSSGTSTGSSSSGGSSGSSPLDATWTLTAITCDGTPANTQIASAYTAPNSTTEAFTSDTMVQTIDLAGCNLIYDWSTTVTASTIAISPTGSSCNPTGCSAACGHNAPADSYTYVISGNTLTVTSVASDTGDVTCTSGGMSNPVVYTLTKS